MEDPILGTTIAGRYRVESRLGEGGMGSVYRVEHTAMRKKLALKLLHREMTRQPEMVARFEREALAAAHIEHPNVAGATDFGKLDDGLCFLVLEYVEGVSLRALVERGPLDPRRAVHIARQMLSALRRAHELGIVHRDLKPENVQLVEKDGDPDFVKVLDFGIARVPIGSLTGSDEGTSLTRSGMVYGTPEYMAPEQALGQEVDGRSDLYSTGVILFEMLAGKRPYDNKDKVALLGQHVAGVIPSVRERMPDLPISEALDAIVARLMAKSPSERFANASEAIEAFDSLDAESPIGGPPRSITMSVTRSLSQATPNEQTIGATASRTALAVDRAPARNLWIGGALGLVAFVVLLVVLLGRGKKADEETASTKKTKPTSTLASDPTGTPLAPAPDLKPRVQAALGKVTAGDVKGGLEELEALGKEGKGDPVVQVALGQAYLKAKRPVDALAAVKQMVVAHPEAATEAALDPIFDEALAQPAAVDAAFKLLENEMKGAGGKILYQIAYGGRGPASLSARAKKSLADPEVQASLTPALKGALELRSMPFACKDKKVVLEKWKDQLDATALPVLKPLTKTTGCGGFFKRDDCWPCLRDDRFLEKIIQGIEERSKSK
ncbi:MAG: serine/threonine protein kinase [Myxococcales bacterium]|nr:serine/threonine protein kinase [Myxococcales bacterium]